MRAQCGARSIAIALHGRRVLVSSGRASRPESFGRSERYYSTATACGLRGCNPNIKSFEEVDEAPKCVWVGVVSLCVTSSDLKWDFQRQMGFSW